jgi:hypothetical protein
MTPKPNLPAYWHDAILFGLSLGLATVLISLMVAKASIVRSTLMNYGTSSLFGYVIVLVFFGYVCRGIMGLLWALWHPVFLACTNSLAKTPAGQFWMYIVACAALLVPTLSVWQLSEIYDDLMKSKMLAPRWEDVLAWLVLPAASSCLLNASMIAILDERSKWTCLWWPGMWFRNVLPLSGCMYIARTRMAADLCLVALLTLLCLRWLPFPYELVLTATGLLMTSAVVFDFLNVNRYFAM